MPLLRSSFAVVKVTISLLLSPLPPTNLRNANGGDSINGNGWGQRYPVIAQIVQYHDFDIFGTQECFIHQLKDMKEALPGYDYIGVGRETAKRKVNILLFSIAQTSLT